MPNEFPRARRVAESIKRALAQPLADYAREHGFGLLTVTAVDLSPDLRNAKVFITAMGGREQNPDSICKALRAASADLRHAVAGEVVLRNVPRHHLAGEVVLRNVPRLNFVYDESLERGRRIEQLLSGKGEP